MHRRHALFSLAAIAAGAALAQAPRRPRRVAILTYGSPANFKSRADALMKAMKDLGHSEGSDIEYVWRNANGQVELLREMARDLGREPVDVIVSASMQTTEALRRAGVTMPVVMVAVDDPVAAGFVKSLARPRTNFTGVTADIVDPVPRHVELLSNAVPKLARIAALVNPANTRYRAYVASLQASVQKSGARLTLVDATTAQQVDGAFQGGADTADGVVVMNDPLFYSERKQIVELADSIHRPAIYPLRGYVEAGGLMSYGPVLEQSFRRAATYVDSILKGADPATMPIESPAKYELVINRNTARRLGLGLPADLIRKADRLIG